ncbi:glycerol-3-phosphate dehydrogenase/oxidase [Lactococcus termiticola]|uniref:Alpha-glycerophosphate oxidase n=1 Tax=Lactococcus termiticola TaxID=2169526 RepID=A0A2R5HDY9_9LACT|nr:glycerol-3-phosphate dehydrogenase/oxidase [Lactococcus termiticola]GBG96283.1 glycerol-3-phosphate dehydrogenase [Lactococcus termiticola]
MPISRKENIQFLKNHPDDWDLIVIGGGATGLGAAVDAAARGFKTVLLEQSDFAKSTSSRSTKLVHGGVRYLQQGDVKLVREALHERGRMARNAPHLVKNQKFIITNRRHWEQPFYSLGLKVYDMLAGGLNIGRSKIYSKKKVVDGIPQIKQDGLVGGVMYYDGQFDDARMAINLMQTATEKGATLVNYTKVTELTKDNGKVVGVKVEDSLDGETFSLKGKAIINATGIFVDEVLSMDVKDHKATVRPSQGVHLIVDGSFLGGNDAIMVPKTPDGRVLFCVPWHNKVILGTTDTPLTEFILEPRPLEEEIDFILETAGQYLAKKPERKDVLSAYAGLRPLAAPKEGADPNKTKEISRSHKLFINDSGLITITGGKWTTYRQMAEETIDLAISKAGLPQKPCVTREMKIHGYKPTTDSERQDWIYVYGSDAEKIQALANEKPELAEKIHPNFEFTGAEVVWAAREEMATSVEDVLARRIRGLFLDARASKEMAYKVADILAQEWDKNEAWKTQQISEYMALADGYILD